MRRSFVISAALVLSIATLAQAAPHGIFPTRQQREFNQLLDRILKAPATRGPALSYYGGPVIANAKVYAVFWGSSVDSATMSQIGGFFTATVNSTYMDWLKEYNTNITAADGRKGTGQAIGRGTFAGSITIQPKNLNTTLQDQDIQAELEGQITAGALPKPDSNSLFMIYFPPNVSITIDNLQSCQAFCAYHEGFVSKTYGNTYYGVMPDQGGACGLGCAYGSSAFDSLTEVTSHELIEAITDPLPTAGSTPAYPQAWNATDGSEIGDLCAGNGTTLTTPTGSFSLQEEYDNSISGCAAGPYQSP